MNCGAPAMEVRSNDIAVTTKFNTSLLPKEIDFNWGLVDFLSFSKEFVPVQVPSPHSLSLPHVENFKQRQKEKLENDLQQQKEAEQAFLLEQQQQEEEEARRKRQKDKKLLEVVLVAVRSHRIVSNHHQSRHSYDDYAGGYTLRAYNLTLGQGSNEGHFHPKQSGQLHVELQFANALAETEYHSVCRIRSYHIRQLFQRRHSRLSETMEDPYPSLSSGESREMEWEVS